MFIEEVKNMANLARIKVENLKNNPMGIFISSMLAGAYVGLAIFLIYTIGGLLSPSPATKIVMGVSFGISLSLVMMAGSELFTGNTLVMGIGFFDRKVSLKSVIKFWIVCYLGNWAGSIVIALLFYFAGYQTGNVGEFITHMSVVKSSPAFVPLFIRAILCNILVTLATWTNYKMKSESGRLIMIFWCLFAFITSGYEHSVANMSLLTLGLLNPIKENFTFSMYFYNILTVTLGNIVGGVLFVGLPYFLIAKKSKGYEDVK